MSTLRASTVMLLAQQTHAWTCGVQPLTVQQHHGRVSALAMAGSFDDMLAKVKDRDEKAKNAPLPEPAAPSVPAESGSLAGNMFSTVSKLFNRDGDDDEDDAEATSSPAGSTAQGAENEVADIDARAQTGKLSFKDFLTMGEAFAGLGDQALPGMPTLTPAQMAETREKFQKHTQIVEVMLDDEKDDPELLMEDLKSGGATPGPRIQRLAKASGIAETEVGLFLMQFEAMRESTRRIAAGEDPDKVNESMSAPPGANRAMRRSGKKAAKKKDKK